jgi:hypothetical protein
MRWHGRIDAATDREEAWTSSQMREAYARLFLNDDPLSSVGRAFSMFYERLSPTNHRGIDVDSIMQSVAGISVHDLWVLCAAIYCFCYEECARDIGAWTFSPGNFVSSPKSAAVTASLRRVLQRIARTPSEIREIYLSSKKFHDDRLPAEYWSSEFNVLRDFPIIALGNDEYCCPFPFFAWARGSVGHYFDLANHFAEIEERTNRKNPNPFDNDMSRLLGEVFQEYVGEELRSLPALAPHLRPEFTYTVGKDKYQTLDWIITRFPGRPIFLECKARRPTLALQTRCSSADREKEIRSVVARSIKQLCVFIENLRDGHVPGLDSKTTGCIFALVLYESFPFHALPNVRETVDRIACELAPNWASLRADVSFVPMSVQELEFAIQIEEMRRIPIEEQLTVYADYRDSAPFVVNHSGRPRFAQHFGDYANEHFANGLGMHNKRQLERAERFLEFMRRELFPET